MAKRGGARRAKPAKARKGRRSASTASRPKPLFIRSAGGRFAGSKSRGGVGQIHPDRRSILVTTPSGRKYNAIRAKRRPGVRAAKISRPWGKRITTQITRADASGLQLGKIDKRGSKATGRLVTKYGARRYGQVIIVRHP